MITRGSELSANVTHCTCPEGTWRSVRILSLQDASLTLYSESLGEFVVAPRGTPPLCDKCPFKTACLGDGRGHGEVSCAAGHTGILCAGCEEGYALKDGECVLCDDEMGSVYGVLGGICGATLIIAALVIRTVMRSSKDSEQLEAAQALGELKGALPTGVIKQLSSFITVKSLMPLTFSLNFPDDLSDLFASLQVVRLDTGWVTRCLFGWNFYHAAMLKLAAPFLIMAVFAGGAAAGAAAACPRRP